MTLYNYKCNICGHDYQEGREDDHPQWFTKCPVTDCTGDLIDVAAPASTEPAAPTA